MTWQCLEHRGGHYFFPEAHGGKGHLGPARRDWGEAAFIGNGMIGASIYKKTPEALTWELGRNDVEAHNHLAGIDWSVPRLPIGDLRLCPVHPIKHESMHLSLYDAEANGETVTSGGRILWQSFACATRDIIVIMVETEGDEDEAQISLHPAHGVSPRLRTLPAESAMKDGPLPSLPQVTECDGLQVAVQELVNDSGEISGEYATAVKTVVLGKNQALQLVGIEHSRENGVARTAVIAMVEAAAAAGLETLRREHRAWWHKYYPQSFLSIPDTRWEGFYWIQMYKLASATRGDMAEVIDNQGPWLTDSAWPGTWWNLNVQLSYSPLCKANRLELCGSLINTIEANQARMRQNADPITDDGIYMGRFSGRLCEGNIMPERTAILAGDIGCFELGNFTWIVKLLYSHYRSCMDKEMLRAKIYPVLRANINVFLALLTEGDDGKLRLPKTTSPEYPDSKGGTSCPAVDTSYDLSLLRWGLQTLILCNNELRLEDRLEPVWRDTLARLAPLAVDDNGIMVARHLPFAVSHRHYSHLFAIYPLHLLDLCNPAEFELAEKSFRHWINLTGALEGYSHTGGACIAATMGDGNLALECLNGLRDYLLPNTMYVEGGGPVIETPLSGAESIHYMLLQCHRDTVRVFPAIPDAWRDVTFANLLAEGAFEVSGKRENGRNQWVQITSQAGQPLRVIPNLPGPVKFHSEQPIQVEAAANGLYTINLQAGASVLLYSGETVPEIKVTPVASQRQFENFYGSDPCNPIVIPLPKISGVNSEKVMMHTKTMVKRKKRENLVLGNTGFRGT